MDVDEKIREVLRGSLVPVDDVLGARREIARRASGVDRRRRWLRASAASAAAAAVIAVVAALLWAAQPTDDAPPVIAPTPDASPTPSPNEDRASSTVCDSLSISDRVDGFLDSWTVRDRSLLDAACVLEGRYGPEPQFDTSDLGPQRSLLPGDIPDGYGLPSTGPLRQRASGYPLVHLGRLEGSDAQMFLEWRLNETRRSVVCVEGVCGPDEVPMSEPGVFGIGRGGAGLTMTVWTTAEASVVSLEVAGQPVVWQRPVAAVSHLLVDDYRPQTDATYEVRVFNAQGEQIATYQGRIDT